MKHLLPFILLLALLAACSREPTVIDNGNLGHIKATVFYDDNRNSTMDSGEIGAQIEVAISVISCVPYSLDTMTIFDTNANGVVLIKDLKPGKYCIGPFGNYNMTTKMIQEVYVSSDMITIVVFGIVRP